MTAHPSSEMFRNSQVNIRNGTFNQVGRDYHNWQNHYSFHVNPEVRKQEALNRLFEHIAPGAFHDSQERRDPPKCHPHTREAVNRDILMWARDPSNLRLLMWIYGPAGAGKSAIMQTVAELCDKLGILGGSFFFFRSAEKRNIADHLIPTLAYQLGKRVPHFEGHLIATILDDPAVFTRNMQSQMKALILDPMAATAAEDPYCSQWCYVILVDGLDECQLEASQQDIINLLSSSAFPHLRFIIASRREFAIRESFSIPYIQNQTQILALDEHYHPDNDIWLFLEEKFQDIKAGHMLRHLLPQDWPGSNVMDTLVRNSSGQFIYAATIIRYIKSPRHSPIKHLATVLSAQLSRGQADTPYALLDALYHQIFAAVDNITAVVNILQVRISEMTEDTNSLGWIETLLGYSPGDAQLILCDMHSLLSIDYGLIQFHHKSLVDFLSSPSRSKHLYIDHKESCQLILTNFLNHFDALLNLDDVNIWTLFEQIFKKQNLALTIEVANILLRSLPNIIKISLQYAQQLDGCSYPGMNNYYQWLDNQNQLSSHYLAVYNASINCLDDQFSALVSEPENNLFFPVIFIYSLKLCPTCIEELTPADSNFKINADDQFMLALKKIATNPIYKTKQILDIQHDADLAFILIKHYFSKLDRPTSRMFNKFEVEHQLTFAEVITKYLPFISVDAKVGKAISTMHQWPSPSTVIHYEKCHVGESQCINYNLCEQYRKYNAGIHFKQVCFKISYAFMNYLKKCSIDIEAHKYTNKHFYCISCQSTQTFLEDPNFFEVNHQIHFDNKWQEDNKDTGDNGTLVFGKSSRKRLCNGSGK